MAVAHDFREGLRTLRRQPGFTIAAVITFALAIGTTTAIFAAVQAVVLRPLPIEEISRLVVIWRQNVTAAGHHPVIEISHRHFRDLRERSRSFERLAAMSSVNWTLAWTLPNGQRRRIDTAAVSHEFFAALGARPALGRTFLREEDEKRPRRVVILSDGFWTRELGRDPAIVGRTLTLDDEPFTVVGVMPRGFAYPQGAELWSPLTPMLEPLSRQYGVDAVEAPGFGVLWVLGRLKPGIQPQQAKRELDPIVRQLQQEGGLPAPEQLAAVVTPLSDVIFGHTRGILFALGGTGLVVLVIACANIVGLLLVRGIARRRESAVRLALGAPRWRMMRLWLAETLLLSAGGLIGGVLLAWWGARTLVTLAPAATPRLDEIGLNVPVLLFAGAICVLSALACGIVPAWMASRLDLREALTAGARDSEGRSRRRARHALVVAQLALALMLLVAAGLMVRSVINLRGIALGYNPAQVVALRVEARGQDARHTRLLYEQMLTRVRALPDVASAGLVSVLPLVLGPVGDDATVMLEGQTFESMAWQKNPSVNVLTIDAGYFETMRTRVVAGRTFAAQDTETSPPVVIVGETAARRLWPGRAGLEHDAVGQRLMLPESPRDAQGRPQWQTVVGVVQDGRFRGIDDVRLDVYRPDRQSRGTPQQVLVRTTADPLRVVAAVRSIAVEMDPRAIVGEVRTLDDIVDTAMAPWRFGMVLFTVLSVVAFALAVTGLFGVISYAVAQRHREIAVRLALGAVPRQVRAMVVRQGAGLVACGVALGLAGAFALSRTLASLLFGVSPADALTLVAVVLLVGAVALAACYLAARRTTRVEATSALR